MDRREIIEKEIRKQIKRLKNKKTPGMDDRENKVWKHGGSNIIKRLKEIINKV